MAILYVTSSEKGSGKTTVCAGLGKYLQDKGKKIGFFKPVIANGKDSSAESKDADFMKSLFNLKEATDTLSQTFKDESSLKKGIKEACARAAKGKDVVIVEGISSQSQVSRDVIEALDAKVILVESYSKDALKALSSQDTGKNTLGIVINKVPKNRMETVRRETAESGASIIGVLPEKRKLIAFTVGELAELIQGEIIQGAEKSDDLVENVMMGALTIDEGPLYYSQKDNKAAIIKSERADMQMATLGTSTSCLVLAGDTKPQQVVLDRAKEKNVPIIITKDEVTVIVDKIEGSLSQVRFNQDGKMPKLTKIMEKHFDFPAFDKGLGLSKK